MSPHSNYENTSTPFQNGTEHPDSNINDEDPVAVIGVALRFPQDAVSPESFWEMLVGGKSARTKVPEERYNIDAFYQLGESKSGTLNVEYGHFVKDDIAGFDAPFFGMQPGEVACTDPAQRWLLEVTYEALENAGITLQQIKGPRTSVFIGSFFQEYHTLLNRDPEMQAKYKAPGTALSMLANRLSWFYDLQGPSITLDTACSSSLSAFHLACQSIKAGKSDISIVGGCNLIYNPESSMCLADLNFLSQDGICRSFDDLANGYARGEGIGIVIVKSLSKALKDGDTIRAVVRATGTNQDGRTPGITQPSLQAQESLIREVYSDAGLDMGMTRFVEAHGTGTSIGDPIEAGAIGSAFKDSRDCTQPLYIGAVKSNIGHLEGAAGIAGLIKTILSLEKGVIPPNIWFDKPNVRISTDKLKIKFPTEPIPWPTNGLRRASVNSFGFGGSNAHAVLDDAYNYLKEHQLSGQHLTRAIPPTTLRIKETPKPLDHINGINGTSNVDSIKTTKQNPEERTTQKLFVFSASDERSLKRLVTTYQQNLPDLCKDAGSFADLAYTLSEKRTSLLWRFFSQACSTQELQHGLEIEHSKLVRSTQGPKICFVFTGQGAQWNSMGRELLDYPVFRRSLQESEICFKEMGSSWSLIDELSKDEPNSNISDASYSQPICTAIQIALVQLLQSWGIEPTVVVGHSSGEIAAAYSTGALSHSSACRVAYYRGVVAASICQHHTSGAMLAVGLPENKVQEYLNREGFKEHNLVIACFNSPQNHTVSGSASAIDELQAVLEREGVFAKRLPVRVAYHSNHMNEVAPVYKGLIDGLTTGIPLSQNLTMFSSVTGSEVFREQLSTTDYWVDNMVSPVKFIQAMENIHFPHTKKLGKWQQNGKIGITVNHILEIGPHSTLKGAIREILSVNSKKPSFSYGSILVRGRSAKQTAMDAIGQLWCLGYPLNIGLINDSEETLPQRHLLVNLPSYPFDHSKKYWLESRISKAFRFRRQPPHELLGTQVSDWNPLEPRWRNFIRLSESPWVQDHNVNGSILYPAAGFLVMAIEAAHQLSDIGLTIKGYRFKDVSLKRAVVVPVGDESVELQLYLRPGRERTGKFLMWNTFRICVFENEEWSDVCDGSVAVEYGGSDLRVNGISTAEQVALTYKDTFAGGVEKCTFPIGPGQFYDHLSDYGLNFGPSFKALTNIQFNEEGDATGTVNLRTWASNCSQNEIRPHIIHPAALDAILQLSFLSLTKGGKETIPTMVPTTFRNLWLSAAVQSKSTMDPKAENFNNDGNISIYTNAKLRGFRNAEASILGFDKGTGVPLIQGNFNTTAVSGFDNPGSNGLAASKKLCLNIDWRPEIEFLDQEQIRAYCTSIHPFHSPYPSIEKEKIFLCHLAWKKLFTKSKGQEEQFLHDKPHLRNYQEWATRRLEKYDQKSQLQEETLDGEKLQDLLVRVEKNDPEGKILVAVMKNLEQIMNVEVDALEILFHEGLVNDYYSCHHEITPAFDQALFYIGTMAHKSPDLKILEIGAGTGAATAKILKTLTSRPREYSDDRQADAFRFDEYVFTDISSSFFEKAKSNFGYCAERMSFKTLDIEKIPTDQGFEHGKYDLIVASNVLHATKSLKTTLDHARMLLKPGGKIVIFEITSVEDIISGFIFGLLPGWWLSTEKSRKWGPCITKESWHSYLIASGFTGLDVDFSAIDENRSSSAMISTAKVPDETSVPPPRAAILISGDSEVQTEAAKILRLRMNKTFSEFDIISVEDLELENYDHKIWISLLEIGQPFIYRVTEHRFKALQRIFSLCDTLIWASSDDPSQANPVTGMITGLARSLRNENSVKYVTVKFQAILDLSRAVEKLSKVILKTLKSSADEYEAEYTEIDGALCIGRLVEGQYLNEFVTRKTTPQSAQPQKFRGDPDRRLKLTIPRPGILSSFQWEDEGLQVTIPLEPNEIEIEVKAVGLNFRDVLIALGQEPAAYLGMEFSGVVTKVGEAAAAKFRPGDRACGLTEGCFRTHVRCHTQSAIKLPDHISFQSAAAFSVVYPTAYYALIKIANLKPKESILIHSGAGGFGQACIQLAKLIGAKIFATVSTEDKKQFLITTYGIDESNIFSSRTPAFVEGIKLLTKGVGVDVIINSLAGEALKCSWECIAPFGRFIEVGKKDIHNFGSLPMFGFSRNASFTGVDLFYIYLHARKIIQELLETCMALLIDGKITVPAPVHLYKTSQIEDAFRFLESGKSMGKIVVEFNENDIVPITPSIKPVYEFNPDATYIISGGLGGIGRSLARWMVDHSAKNLILLSRSRTHSKAAVALLKELREKGINVSTPACDVADESALKKALQQCSDMPPIKGCIQASMVLKDTIFAKMSISDFNTAVKPKVDGSWNLHNLLPRNLDFFILLSSIAGILGTYGQSNYAAGNTYQDALAQYRVSIGEKAISLDLGIIQRVGYVAEAQVSAAIAAAESFGGVSEKELLAILEYACDPNLAVESMMRSQVVIGIETPAALKARGEEVPYWMRRPLFRPLYQIASSEASLQNSVSSDDSVNYRELITEATTINEVSEIIISGLQAKLSRTLGTEKEDIDPGRPMHVYGLDSLSAVEVRTWMRSMVGIDVTVFEILGNKSITELVTSVAPKSQFLSKSIE